MCRERKLGSGLKSESLGGSLPPIAHLVGRVHDLKRVWYLAHLAVFFHSPA